MSYDKVFCECGDPGCPHCAANCTDHATAIVYRVDMTDVTGTLLCDECTEDAMESGLFEVGQRFDAVVSRTEDEAGS